MTLLQILGIYITLSVAAFALYALDKSAARHSQWRIPESLLHSLGLAGGWPGAWIAQRMLHHKTRKAGFRFVFLLTAVINLCFLGWLLHA